MGDLAQQYRDKHRNEWTVDLDGLKFRVRRPTPLHMIRQGLIPARLYKASMRISGLDGKEPNVEKDSPAETKEHLEFMALFLVAAVIEPKLVMEDPKEGELLVADLDEDHFFRLFTSVHSGAGRGEATGPRSETFPKTASSPAN